MLSAEASTLVSGVGSDAHLYSFQLPTWELIEARAAEAFSPANQALAAGVHESLFASLDFDMWQYTEVQLVAFSERFFHGMGCPISTTPPDAPPLGAAGLTAAAHQHQHQHAANGATVPMPSVGGSTPSSSSSSSPSSASSTAAATATAAANNSGANNSVTAVHASVPAEPTATTALSGAFPSRFTRSQLLLASISLAYRATTPFHNWRHAFTVAQSLYVLLKSGCAERFSESELRCLLLAALCHDLDHPGYANNFHVAARTSLALRYSDQSPLENHHSCVAASIFADPRVSPFVDDSGGAQKVFRALFYECLLGTDLAGHASMMKAFQEILARPEGLQWTDTAQRHLAAAMLLKAADVSNESRIWDVSHRWALRLLAEWRQQVAIERSLNLPVTAMMDVSNPDQVRKSQLGFIDFMLIPLFSVLCNLFPCVSFVLDGIRRNRARWEGGDCPELPPL